MWSDQLFQPQSSLLHRSFENMGVNFIAIFGMAQ